MLTNSDNVRSWKPKDLSEEIIEPFATSGNSLNLVIN